MGANLRPLTRWMRLRSALMFWFSHQLAVPIHISTDFYETIPKYPGNRHDLRHRIITHWIAYALGLHVKIDGLPYGRPGIVPQRFPDAPESMP
jgi:hypothetical protein